MPLTYSKYKLWVHWITAAFGVMAVLLAAEPVSAQSCSLRNNPPPVIQHDLNISYCELCDYGLVTIVISNPYRRAELTDMTVVEDLRDSGLTFYDAASTPVTVRVDGGFASAVGDPNVSGTAGSILTWTQAEIPQLAGPPQSPGFDTLTITFPVVRHSGLTQVGLVSAVRDIRARIDYSAVDPIGQPPYPVCSGTPDTAHTPVDELPLREPEPDVIKRGRNYDADQDGWSQTVYGNEFDDVIWRIRFRNRGPADLQDLRFDDTMLPDTNLDINYVCPTAGAAASIAANNGAGPGACIEFVNGMRVGNVIDNFDVDNPFGNPSNDSPDLVDVPRYSHTDIYLVGKIPDSDSADGEGSCSPTRSNFVDDVWWGCETDPPGNRINRTSTGVGAGDATAYLSTRSDNDLDFNIRITGVGGNPRAGTKGRVRITITNRTGGTVKNIKLHDVLPPEYVVDPTYRPRVAMDSAYGPYPGMTDNIIWDNPVAGTYPDQTSTNPDDYLNNTEPRFTLTSSGCSVGQCGPTRNWDYADQMNMLRHGDRLEITFGIILIRSESYDKTADLDVREEDPNSDPPHTDPDNDILLSNQLNVTFENFCRPGTIYSDTFDTTHQSDPEDLDVNIAGSELVFILTGDPNQRLPLTVNLTNNGGHDADDHIAYVTFGRTMEVVTVPGVCSLTSNPPPHDVWRDPAEIPADAAVYQCTGGTIGPGSTVSLNFEVIKSGNPDDIQADDLTFRADGVGVITLHDGTPLWFPPPANPRTDGGHDAANNYSLEAIRARVLGFNLVKTQVGTCTENNPPPTIPDALVQIGEECTYHIEAGGWFGFKTPGFTLIAVQDIRINDQLPDGQGYISSTNPYLTSTSAIQGINLSSPLNPLQEGTFYWTFNQGPALQIRVKDHWFRADTTERLLNDPIDTRAAPNVHAAPSINILDSEFLAIFRDNVTGNHRQYVLDSSTVGYPRVEVRSVELTVTEPRITVVKEVCNESLYGAGPACSNFVPLADDGDAYDSYIYRLTVTNEAESDGVARAPAYDVTVTDVLDASDLAYVLPFTADGLDNDADGAFDESGTGDGTIGDNLVKNGTPAEITFSYTHSSALLRIDPGQSVELFYRVDYDDDAAPLQTFTNAAEATYDSLEGDFGNQSAPRRPNSDIGGARFYTSEPASAAVRVIPVLTEPKQIAALSNTALAAGSDPQPVSVGEEIAYRLRTLLPVALLSDFVIQDELPAGIRCTEAPDVNLNAPPYDVAGFQPGGIIAPTCSGNSVEWDFGDQRVTNGALGTRYEFEISFIARVDNTAAINDGVVLSNGQPATAATARYIDESGNPVVLDFGQVDVVVREPDIALTKAFAVAAVDAGDVLTVTVTAENTGTAPAYNLRVLDDLSGRNLTFTGDVGGSAPPDVVDTSTFGANQPIFGWSAPNGIAPGDSIEFTFDVRVDDIVQPHEVLDNTLRAVWTSLPGQTTALNSSGRIGPDGDADGMRIGALPHAGDAVNDYETVAAAQTEVYAVTLAKTDASPTLVPTIGAHNAFQLDIVLPEGVTNDVVVTDDLAAAGLSYVLTRDALFDITYTFEGIAEINGSTTLAETDFNAYPAHDDRGSIVWDIGTVVTDTENDPSQNAVTPRIRIHYYARVNNDLDTDSGDSLQNAAQATYTHGETGAAETLSAAAAAVTVVEPRLAPTKTVSNVTAGKQPTDTPEGGDVLEYVVTITNTGTATAHDVNVEDILDTDLVYDSSFTPTATIDGVAVSGFRPSPLPIGGSLFWGRENGDENLDIPPGKSLLLTYRATVFTAGDVLENLVWIDWTSLDGAIGYERTGDGCPTVTAPNDYCEGPEPVTVITADTNAIVKTVSEDTYDVPPLSTATDAVARVGDTITYRLALNLREGLTRDVQVQDVLPAGMAFVDIVGINGDSTAPYTAPSSGEGSNFDHAPIAASSVPATGQTGTLTWTIGDVVNDPFGDSTTDTLTILYRARILPDAGIAHAADATLTNTTSLGYAGADPSAPELSSAAAVTLYQPLIPQVFKTDRGVHASPADIDVVSDVMQFQLRACNTGAAPAYNVEFTDRLADQLDETSIANLQVAMDGTVLTAGSDYVYTAPATRGGTMHFDFNIPLDPGTPLDPTCVTIDYDIGFYTDFGPNRTWSNSVTVDRYWSLPAQSGQQYGPVGPAAFEMTNTVANTEPAKTIVSPASAEAYIGEQIVYRITVPAAPVNAALHDVRILDDLSASSADLTFVGVVKISGSQPWTPENTGTDTNLVIEDPDVGIDIPAGEQIVIEIAVLLADTPTNVDGLQFDNTVEYSYVDDDPADPVPGGTGTSPQITIVEPDDLVLDKSGPATMQFGAPATFTLDVRNAGTGTAWNPEIVDRLPNQADGGMCAAGPTHVTAQLDTQPLDPATDFTVEFSGEPDCEWTIRLLSPAGGLPSGQHLVITYELLLDADTVNAAELINVAGVTRWHSADPETAGAAPRTYERELTDGTPLTEDHQDRHSVTAEAPILEFLMSVENLTTGQNPGRDASPGDTLRYTLTLENSGPVGLSAFTLSEELDRLNTPPVFLPGSLSIVSAPTGADTTGTDPVGGTHGTGFLNVDSLSIGAQGQPDNTVTVVFDAALVSMIASGTVVLGQSEMAISSVDSLYSDDPNLAGDEDPTETRIASAPVFEVLKTSTILSGDPTVLMAGETLRYRITIQNIGDEDAEDVRLRDTVPAHTTYVAGSTTLNGAAVADSAPGISPLEAGMSVHAPENATAGYLRADASPGATNVATVTFDVVVDPDAMDGLIVENQGFVSGSGLGSGLQPEQPSDDPNTPTPDDPTRNVVGNLPLLYAHKTVQIVTDGGSAGIVDPDDVLRYTIAVHNFGAIPATDVVLTDDVPTHTAYVPDSLRLNGSQLGAGSTFPLIAGLAVQSSDNPGAGIISAGERAEVTFDVQVDSTATTGTRITNQGSLTSDELPAALTDADGLPSNGYQPTVVIVGDVQVLSITKQVLVVGGGVATAGGQLEYVVRATNIGSLPATDVAVRDDLSPPLGDQVTYLGGSGTLNGAAAGVVFAGDVLTADYAGTYGDLPPGESAVVRFRVEIDSAAVIGTTITNTAEVRWDSDRWSAEASASLDVGGTPGSGALNGNVWHDASLDTIYDTDGETGMEGWSVDLYRNGQPVTSVTSDAGGRYRLDGLLPNEGTADRYEIRFRAPGAGPETASLGTADSIFVNGPQRIREVTVASGDNVQNVNLPLWPNGAVYDSVARTPVAGARLTLLNAATGAAVPRSCFDDPIQQNQVTTANGFYKFDLNFGDGGCPAGGAYLIEVTAPASGYLAAPSRIIPPSSDASTAPFDIPACPGSAVDAVPTTAEFCEVSTFAAIPPLAVPPDSPETDYHLHLVLDNGLLPGHSQVFNNPIPLDPELEGAVAITKTASMLNVTRGALVPYTITVSNVFGAPLYNLRIVDRFPAGFKYVADSARLNGSPSEPRVDGRELIWDDLELQVNQKHTLQLLLVVGAGVTEGEYVNRAQMIDTAIGDAVSGEATATVRVIPDPDFDCTDVIGKVFDDRNLNGWQDAEEIGLAGVRVVTVRGLIATTDEYGRFHITCAAVPDEDRGSNFILKLDERSLPSGYRLTTENPRVQRATRGKMLRFNFGATIHRVVRMDIADGVFEPEATELRLQWASRIDPLLAELQKAPSILRLAYLADVERESLVRRRLEALKQTISRKWEQSEENYRLTIETEIFWRRGAPVAGH